MGELARSSETEHGLQGDKENLAGAKPEAKAAAKLLLSHHRESIQNGITKLGSQTADK
ncbi:MAG: hypothetical protein ACYCVD_03700 [Desulfitobacteriaceae bacterium]